MQEQDRQIYSKADAQKTIDGGPRKSKDMDEQETWMEYGGETTGDELLLMYSSTNLYQPLAPSRLTAILLLW